MDDRGFKTKVCPFSGLIITYKDEWCNIPFTDSYSGSFELIDSNILHTQAVGDSSNSEAVSKFFKRRVDILSECNLLGTNYYELKDYSQVYNNPGKQSRMVVKDTLEKEEGHLHAFVCYGGSFIVRTILRVANNLFTTPIKIESARSYEEGLERILQYRSGTHNVKLPYAGVKTVSAMQFGLELRNLVDTVGQINWKVSGDEDFHEIPDTALFKQVYDLLAVIKSDNDVLIESLISKEEEQRTTNVKLNELMSELSDAKMNLEVKVEKRTVELQFAKDMAEEAMQVKSRFLANMSHELRTPLHAILSFAELGEKRSVSIEDNKIPKYFGRIKESGDRLLETVSDILDLSKLASGKVSYIKTKNSIADTIKTILNELAQLIKNKSIYVDLSIECTYKVVMYDNVRIMQVLRNLLSNAIKFSPVDSTITIQIKDSFLIDEISFIEYPSIECRVIDEGVGIPKGELISVFDEFVQSSSSDSGAGGTGLGLAISKEIIENHQGQIWAMYNKHGPGSTFIFSIPIEPHGNTEGTIE
ncbi:MAG: HAMP domain-containing histidine kinase [Fibrobacterales bacterium]